MNRIEALQADIVRALPKAVTTVEPPLRDDGVWWLDVRQGDHALVVEWRASHGFGVSSLPGEGFGGGADEIYHEPAEVLARVRVLLTTGGRTMAPDAVGLRRLREQRHVSQEELAGLIGTGQAAVSKIERRADLQVSMLQRVVEALGGELEITARFGDDRVRIDPSAR